MCLLEPTPRAVHCTQILWPQDKMFLSFNFMVIQVNVSYVFYFFSAAIGSEYRDEHASFDEISLSRQFLANHILTFSVAVGREHFPRAPPTVKMYTDPRQSQSHAIGIAQLEGLKRYQPFSMVMYRI